MNVLRFPKPPSSDERRYGEKLPKRLALAGGLLVLMGLGACSERDPADEDFLRRASAFTPLQPASPDETMPLPDLEAAAELGHRLFFDQRLSGDGTISCATCHDPEHGFADPRPLADGMGQATRHAPTLLHVAHHRWFGWGGKADTLWSQAIGPLESAHEMGGHRLALVESFFRDETYADLYNKAFRTSPQISRFLEPAEPGEQRLSAQEATALWPDLDPSDQNATHGLLADSAKALAAYQRKLVTGPSPFDRYVEALAAGESTEDIPFGEAERRGFELFAGKARCFVCHSGPFFSDGEFHNTGAPPLHGGEPEDPGRYRDGKLLQADPFNATGEFSADREGQTAERTRLLKIGSEQWGEFKTPTLRNVDLTPPYMHQGQFETLEAVVAFYDTLENSVGASHHQEQILQPIGLTEAERADLVAFLRSLTGTPVPEKWTQDPFP